MRVMTKSKKGRPQHGESPFFLLPSPDPIRGPQKGPHGGQWTKDYCHSCMEPFDPVPGSPHSRKSIGHGTCVSCLDRLKALALIDEPLFAEPVFGKAYTSERMGFLEV